MRLRRCGSRQAGATVRHNKPNQRIRGHFLDITYERVDRPACHFLRRIARKQGIGVGACRPAPFRVIPATNRVSGSLGSVVDLPAQPVGPRRDPIDS
jgi:hypothetical protein